MHNNRPLTGVDLTHSSLNRDRDVIDMHTIGTHIIKVWDEVQLGGTSICLLKFASDYSTKAYFWQEILGLARILYCLCDCKHKVPNIADFNIDISGGRLRKRTFLVTEIMRSDFR
jgi:hypothetical protein